VQKLATRKELVTSSHPENWHLLSLSSSVDHNALCAYSLPVCRIAAPACLH